MSENVTNEITEKVDNGKRKAAVRGGDLSIESVTLLVCTEKVTSLEEATRKELKELRERQELVKFLHRLIKILNLCTDSKGNCDLSEVPELAELLEEAKNLGVDIDPSKTTYTKDERDRLIENVKITVDDYNIQNEMQLQKITRLTNERYEIYQMARSILKPLHDAKINKARALGGR
jgi:hypothetical protein